MRRALLIGALLLSGCFLRKSAAADTAEGGPTSPLELKLPRYPSGELFDLSTVRGNVVLLDIWATWCEPCKDALPTYEVLAKEFQDRGLKVYAVSVDADGAQITRFLKETQVSLPILHDVDAQIAEQRLKVRMMPTTFLLDRRGNIRHMHEGFAENFAAQYRSEIEALLAEQG